MRLRSLTDLAALRKVLADEARAEAEGVARERAEAERLEHERTLFARSVGRVDALQTAPRARVDGPRPAAEPRQRVIDEQAVLRESLSDGIDVETLLETDDALSWRRPDIGPDVVRKLRRGEWAIQAEVDMHGLRRDEARERLTAFLRDSTQRGLRCVRVVHGKGHGSPGREPVLKAKVRGWLVQTAAVLAFVSARAGDGGHGALVVLLRSAGATPGA
jgi:DNA-nicking Smr family endonuclease